MTNFERLLSDEEILAAFLISQSDNLDDICACCNCEKTRTRYECVMHANEYGADCKDNISDWLLSPDVREVSVMSRFELYRKMSIRRFARQLANWGIAMGGIIAPYSWKEIISGNVAWLEQEAKTE